MKFSEAVASILLGARDAGLEITPDPVAQSILSAQPIAAELVTAEPNPETEQLRAKLEEQSKALAEANARLDALSYAGQVARFEALMQPWFGETSIHRSMLDLLAKTEGGEQGPLFTSYVTMQNAIAEQLKSSKIFEPLGSSGASTGPTAWSRILVLAQAEEKATGCSRQEAIARVAEQHPTLYREYQAEYRPA